MFKNSRVHRKVADELTEIDPAEAPTVPFESLWEHPELLQVCVTILQKEAPPSQAHCPEYARADLPREEVMSKMPGEHPENRQLDFRMHI